MPARLEVYKCEACGNIVEVLDGGKGSLVCCGKPMVKFTENTVDAAREKHVPVVEAAGDGLMVKVGEVPHPMEEKHYIQWIEIVDGDRIKRKYLKPGEAPEASFCSGSDAAYAREYCNLHGLWKSGG
jgi:superoxide reductase